jgi:GNAT superfamily N-acetyltransferase
MSIKEPIPPVIQLRSDEDILRSWEVVLELRPHLQKDRFLATIREMMQEDGYQMIGIPSAGENQGIIAAFAGFRHMHKLHMGRGIYIDDLCTLPAHRGKGYGGQLLDYIHGLARENGKDNVTLDSGYQRHAAHRLYLNKGYVLGAHHLNKKLD